MKQFEAPGGLVVRLSHDEARMFVYLRLTIIERVQ